MHWAKEGYDKRKQKEFNKQLDKNILTFKEKMENANMHIPEKELKKLRKMLNPPKKYWK